MAEVMSPFNQTFDLPSGAKVQIIDEDQGRPQRVRRTFVAILIGGFWPEDMTEVTNRAHVMGRVGHYFEKTCTPVGVNAYRIEFVID